MMQENLIKVCTRCHLTFVANLENFSPAKLGKYGFAAYCRACMRSQRKIYSEANKAKRIAYRAARPEWVKETKQRHYQKHRASVIFKAKLYRSTNPGYWKLTPEQYKVKSAARRNRKFLAGGKFSAQDLLDLHEKQVGCCNWCKVELEGSFYHVDHITPLARGGSNGPENICLACPACNLQKGDRTPEQWFAASWCRARNSDRKDP